MDDFLEGLGSNKKNFAEPKTAYEKYIVNLSRQLTAEFKEEVNKKSKGSGALGSSMVARPSKDGFTIEGDFYYKFIDEGVNAAPKQKGLKYVRPLVTSSPYSFKHAGVGKKMANSIRSIVGGDISNVYKVAVSIKKHGIKAKNITENVMTDKVLDQIAQDLLTITGLNFEFSFDKAFGDSVK